MRRLLMSRLIRIFTVYFVSFFISKIKKWNKQGRCRNLPDVQSYLTTLYIHGKNWLRPQAVIFFFQQIKLTLEMLVEGHLRTICAKLFSNRSSSVWQEDVSMFSHVFPMYTWEKLIQPPGGHVLQQIKFIYSRNVGRGSHKDHLSQIISNQLTSFWQEKFSMFSLYTCIHRKKWLCPLAAMF